MTGAGELIDAAAAGEVPGRGEGQRPRGTRADSGHVLAHLECLGRGTGQRGCLCVYRMYGSESLCACLVGRRPRNGAVALRPTTGGDQ